MYTLAKSCDVRLPMGIPFGVPSPRTVLAPITPDNLPQKRHRVCVANSSAQHIEQDFLIHRVEKFPHIALQGEAGARIVSAFRSQHFSDFFHTPVGPLADAAGKGCGNKCRLEYWIKHSENRVVQNPIPHRRLMYPAQLRIMNAKTNVLTVLVGLVSQGALQCKDILLKFHLESQHIFFVALVFLESIPRCKQSFGGCDRVEQIFVSFHAV